MFSVVAKMPLPPVAVSKVGVPGCFSDTACIGKIGDELFYDDNHPDRVKYCEACWAAEPIADDVSDSTEECLKSVVSSVGAVMASRFAEHFAGEPLLIHQGVSLSASIASGSDESLGEAVVVFIDSRDSKQVGSYTLAAFIGEEAAPEGCDPALAAPAMKVQMGAGTRLVRDNHGQHAFRLHSGGDSWLVSFKGRHEAESFLRDFRVRNRLMKLALKVSQLTTENTQLKARQQSGISVCRWLVPIVPVVVAAMGVAGATLVK